MEKIFVPNHLHLLIKGYINNPPKEAERVNVFLKDLVERVRMKVVAGPTSVYVDDPGNEGATGTVTLATSHAAIHIWDASIPSLFQFDIYSCSEFSIEEVVGCINDHFGIVSGNYLFIDRNTDDFQEIESGTLS
jgi:S-adenosylmethionine/arginine decarboxylase-like enzyme